MDNQDINIVELDEKIEKHQELNPKLFNGDGLLKDEVREKMLLIVDTFLDGLEEDNIKIILSDILLIGSNASYNYTENSDIDLHVIADTSSLHCPDNLYPALYSAYRSLFDKKYDISIYGIPVELYVETEDVETKSNGIYSVKDNEWIKEPEILDIPEVDQEAIDEESADWKEKCKNLLAYVREKDIDLDQAYDDIVKLIDDIYELRKQALKDEGEYSTGNLVFKEIRNAGLLDALKDAKTNVTSRWLTLESLKEELTNQKLEEYRIQIGRLVHTQPLVQRNGYFFIHNVKENDVGFILNILRRQDFIDYVRQGAAGKYDFSHINPTRGPQRLYTIEGKIRDFD